MKKANLSEKNKKFWAMTKPQQRVAVAKDVIKQLNNGFLDAREGVYFRPEFNEIIEIPQLDKAITQIKKQGGHCTVCGIGGCFVSLVRLGDKVETEEIFGVFIEPRDSGDDYKMKQLLRKVFTPDQLSMIECAFERYTGHGDAPYQDRIKAAQFGRQYSDSKNRLIAIMKNIIKNKGEFKP